MEDRTCTAQGCERPVKVKSRGWCWTHYKRWQKHGSPDVVLPWPGSGVRGADSPRWKGDDAGYFRIHQRIKLVRGKASDHVCSHCSARADEWAYGHSDIDAKRDPAGRLYSLDANHYIPLCKGCHQLFDRSQQEVGDGQPVRGVQEAT